MNSTEVEAVAAAILYEGYLLYPYRSTSVKNQTRWTFGADGTVSEDVITTPGGGSPTDATSTGEWQASDGTLTVVFSVPDSSSSQFGYLVNGDTLRLNGIAFVKGQ